MSKTSFSSANVLFIASALVLAAAGFANAVTNVTACANLSIAGTYYALNQSVSTVVTTAPCFNITADDVTLDCAYYGTQYNITGPIPPDGSSDGVYLEWRTNVTVKNCLITAFDIGVYANSSSNNNSFVNNTANNNTYYGFYSVSSYNNNFTDNTANNNSYGFRLDSSSNNSLFVNNTANNNTYGFVLHSSSNNSLFVNNTANDNSVYGFYLASSNNSFANNNASGNGMGFILKSSSENNTNNNNFTNNMVNYNGWGFYLDSWSNYNSFANNTVNNNWFTGLELRSSSNNSFTNNTVNNNTNYGFYLSLSSNYNSFANNTVTNTSTQAFYLSSSSNNVFANNTVNYNRYNSNNGNAFCVLSSSNNNSFVNNTANYNNGLAYVSSSYNNSFANNTATDNYAYGLFLTSSLNNTITGNRFTSSGAAVRGIYFQSGSNYSVLSGNNVTTNGGGESQAVYFYTSYWNNVSDSVFSASSAGVPDVYVRGFGTNNFTNCSFNKSDTGFNSSATGGFNVFWYADGRVTDNNGLDLAGAYVNASNVNGTSVFNASTNATGWIPRQTVFEYWQNITGVYNATPHWFNASSGAYSNNSQSGVSGNVVLTRALGLTRGATLDSPADGTRSVSYAQVFCFTPVSPGSMVNASLFVNGPGYYYSAVNASGLVSASQHCFNSVTLPLVGTYYWSVLFYDSYNYIQTDNFSLTVYNENVGGGGGGGATPTPAPTPTPTVTPSPTASPSVSPAPSVSPEVSLTPVPSVGATLAPTPMPTGVEPTLTAEQRNNILGALEVSETTGAVNSCNSSVCRAGESAKVVVRRTIEVIQTPDGVLTRVTLRVSNEGKAAAFGVSVSEFVDSLAKGERVLYSTAPQNFFEGGAEWIIDVLPSGAQREFSYGVFRQATRAELAASASRPPVVFVRSVKTVSAKLDYSMLYAALLMLVLAGAVYWFHSIGKKRSK